MDGAWAPVRLPTPRLHHVLPIPSGEAPEPAAVERRCNWKRFVTEDAGDRDGEPGQYFDAKNRREETRELHSVP
jgi:hypothetical protein